MAKYCFDLDGVLLEWDIIIEASILLVKEEKINKIYSGRDITSWQLDGVPDCVKEKAYELFNIKKYAVDDKRIIAGVQVFLEYLKYKKHHLSILTARPAALHYATINYIHDKFGPDLFNDIKCVDG